jgi:hypothetical protein
LNITGQKMKQLNIYGPTQDKSTLILNNLNELPSGIYLVKIKMGNQTLSKKIIKL